jgi:hypothetical protein
VGDLSISLFQNFFILSSNFYSNAVTAHLFHHLFLDQPSASSLSTATSNISPSSSSTPLDRTSLSMISTLSAFDLIHHPPRLRLARTQPRRPRLPISSWFTHLSAPSTTYPTTASIRLDIPISSARLSYATRIDVDSRRLFTIRARDDLLSIELWNTTSNVEKINLRRHLCHA